MAIYSDIIKELRKDKGWNQKDMAKHFGISQSVYSDCETGKRRMSVEMLIELGFPQQRQFSTEEGKGITSKTSLLKKR